MFRYLFIYRQSPPQRELYMDRERDRERDYYQDYQRASYRSVNMVLYRSRSTKMFIFSYWSVIAFVLGAQKNRLIETVLLSTHNICFG